MSVSLRFDARMERLSSEVTKKVGDVSRAHELAQTVRGGIDHIDHVRTRSSVPNCDGCKSVDALNDLERLAGEAERLREALESIVKETDGEVEIDVRWINKTARAALEASE